MRSNKRNENNLPVQDNKNIVQLESRNKKNITDNFLKEFGSQS